MRIQSLLPFAALGLVALALYLAYKSVNIASPYLTQQPEIVLNETSWVRIPAGVTDTVSRGMGANAETVKALPYAGMGGPWAGWRG